MSEEDDWFERAVGGDEESRTGDDESDVATAEESQDASDDGSLGASDESQNVSDGEGGVATDADTGPEADTADGPFGDDGDADPFGGDADATPFGDDGGPDASGGDSPFEEDFASAFEGGGGDAEFDDADLDSDIPRVDLGVEGLDDMIQGGIPARHLMTAIGSAGTGKTTFGLQFLHHGLQHGENGVFITLEQSHEAILDTAHEWGWDFEGYEADDELAIVDLDPVEMANSLDNIRGELPELIEDFGADRLVLDSVSLLEMMYDDPAQRRTEVYDFTRSLKRAGVTTFLTSEASESNPYASRHGIIEYLTDAVFVLQYVRAESRETRLAVEIMKIRNANHSRATKPYELTSEGISVYQQANIF